MDTACDLAQVDRFACFRWDEVEWAIRDLDEAVETNAGGSHDMKESCCLRSRDLKRVSFC